MVVARYRGETTVTLRGPETNATEIECPADCEWLGVALGAMVWGGLWLRNRNLREIMPWQTF